MTTLHAGIPVWVFTPQTPTTITIASNDNATISYKITNQSHVPHTLLMKPIPGITPSGNCSTPIGYQQSCTLNLQISGSALQGNVVGGPVLCQDGNPLQCYQPSQANSLNITLTAGLFFTITPSTDGNGTISPQTPQTVGLGDSVTFTAVPHANYAVYQWLVDGVVDPNANGFTRYTLSDITANHTVEVTFTSTVASIVVLPTILDIVAGSHTVESVTLTNESPTVDAQGLTVMINDPTPVGIVQVVGPENNCGMSLPANESCNYYFQQQVLSNSGSATATISGNNTLASATVTINVNPTPPYVDLTTSVTSLALSVKRNATATQSALPGNPRHITITNTDPMYTAFNVAYDTSPLPDGTTISPATCGNILHGAKCVLTITPGLNPSADPYVLNPTPITPI